MRRMGRLALATAVISALGLTTPVQAPAQTKAGVVTTVQGTANVARAASTEPTPLKFRDDVFVQDRITTGDQSIARILLGGKAVVTVRERSQLTIRETATTSTLEVTGGKIALAVNKSRMRPGDVVEIKTPNAVAAVRGTVVITEVGPAPAGGVASTFTLLTGLVDVTLLDPSGRPTGNAVKMTPRDTVAVRGFTAPSAPRSITRKEAESIASDYRVNLREPSVGVNADVTERQVKEATARSAALLEDSSKTPSRDKDTSESGDRKTDTSDKSDRTDGGAVSGGVTGGGATGGSGGGTGGTGLKPVGDRLADRGLGGSGDLFGDKKVFGRGIGGGGSTGSGGGGIGDNVGVGGDDVRKDRLLRKDKLLR
jgi:hypothetical protein